MKFPNEKISGILNHHEKITNHLLVVTSGVNISQKNRNYSVWEGNETYKISKTFPKFKKKLGSFLLLLY